MQVSQTTIQALSQGSPINHSAPQNPVHSSHEDFSDDNDEENDPVIHSFGPFGENLLPRLASFTAGSSPQAPLPDKSTRPQSRDSVVVPTKSPQPSYPLTEFDFQSHVINQLAFSRLSSTPLSTIASHLPKDAGSITIDDLRTIIQNTSCIGEVAREGKDAAGKRLESEYYYVPNEDEDEKRREAVVNDLRKPGLRACRKQHKVRAHPRGLYNMVTDKER